MMPNIRHPLPIPPHGGPRLNFQPEHSFKKGSIAHEPTEDSSAAFDHPFGGRIIAVFRDTFCIRPNFSMDPR